MLLPQPIDKGVKDFESFLPVDKRKYERQHDENCADDFYGPHTRQLNMTPALRRLQSSKNF